jgi:hypothetical protein
VDWIFAVPVLGEAEEIQVGPFVVRGVGQFRFGTASRRTDNRLRGSCNAHSGGSSDSVQGRARSVTGAGTDA